MKKNRNAIQQCPHCGSRGGFTLIELMVVLVLLALLTGMIAPAAVSALRRSGITAQAEDLAEMLRFAQRYAVTSRQPVQVNLDRNRGICWATSIQTSLPWVEGADERRRETLATFKLSRDIALSVESTETGANAWDTITFKSNGQTDDALLRLSDGRSEPVELLVVGTEGSVRYREGSGQ